MKSLAYILHLSKQVNITALNSLIVHKILFIFGNRSADRSKQLNYLCRIQFKKLQKKKKTAYL